MTFHLIKFHNGDIAVVPDQWCDDGMVSWPKYKNTERVKRAAANSETPEQNWPKYDMVIIRTCGMPIHKTSLKIISWFLLLLLGLTNSVCYENCLCLALFKMFHLFVVAAVLSM